MICDSRVALPRRGRAGWGHDLVRLTGRHGRPAGLGGLPRRRGDRHDDVPRGGAGEAAAARGPCGSRQDRDSPRRSRGRRAPSLVRLQCYEGLDEARALYEWNYKKQLLRIQAANAAGGGQDWNATHDDIFTEEFLLTRPLLTAIRREQPTVLLIDEVDKTDIEVEGLLLEVLSDFQVTIPEPGHGRGHPAPVRRADLQREPRGSPRRSSGAACTCTSATLTPPASGRSCSSRCPASTTGSPARLVATVARMREPGPEEGALDRGVRRLGPHPDRTGDPRPRRPGRPAHARRRAQAPVRPRARDQGTELARA
ncbi:hypothetical protein [Nocardioides convexus]|uniref:hypothetical protein n=1 Tax=Nocardioides convexus TaxID=2712224 RepID=UPI0024183F91|nr:hypothetical protein [Nocardioides convexus]